MEVNMDNSPDGMVAPPSDMNSPAPVARSRRWSRFAGTVFIALLVLWAAVYFVILPLIGLFTGHLLLLGRSGGTGWVEGPWARIISALLLLVTAYFFYFVRKSRIRPRIADKLPIWQNGDRR
jgi:hypothetical protein